MVRHRGSLRPLAAGAEDQTTAGSDDPTDATVVWLGRNGVEQLYRRPLDQFSSTPIAGTNDADSPFFSPDGHWIGFFANGEISHDRLYAHTGVLTLFT